MSPLHRSYGVEIDMGFGAARAALNFLVALTEILLGTDVLVDLAEALDHVVGFLLDVWDPTPLVPDIGLIVALKAVPAHLVLREIAIGQRALLVSHLHLFVCSFGQQARSQFVPNAPEA
jgi:hypothetical protein